MSDDHAAEQVSQIRAILENSWNVWPQWQTGLQSAWRHEFLIGVLQEITEVAFDEVESNENLPVGLCGNRSDHDPHRHQSAALGVFWCSADQATRLPFAAEQRE